MRGQPLIRRLSSSAKRFPRARAGRRTVGEKSAQREANILRNGPWSGGGRPAHARRRREAGSRAFCRRHIFISAPGTKFHAHGIPYLRTGVLKSDQRSCRTDGAHDEAFADSHHRAAQPGRDLVPGKTAASLCGERVVKPFMGSSKPGFALLVRSFQSRRFCLSMTHVRRWTRSRQQRSKSFWNRFPASTRS